MTGKKQKNKRAVALIMAVAIMAVLAVVGFSFASSAKLEYAATGAIRHRTEARFAAYGAIQFFQGALTDDAIAAQSDTAGPIADHFMETLFTTPFPAAQEIVARMGNLTVKAAASTQPYFGRTDVKVRDASSKMNLNAFGNLSKWYAGDFPNSKGAGDISDPTLQVYHGVNKTTFSNSPQASFQRFSSFEVSFEEFFYYYYNNGYLWNSTWPAFRLTTSAADKKEARIRCANLARAICLYRYGPNRKPGVAGPGVAGDDDKDNDFGTNGLDDDGNGVIDGTDPGEVGFGLAFDGLDNDGDGVIDEAGEGIDEPDEYNPYKLFGDDVKYTNTLQARDAFKATYGSVPSAVSYAAGDTDAEATRVFDAVKDELTVDSYTLDISSASIDYPGTDGYDNDGDGLVDEDATADPDGAVTLLGANQLLAQINAGKTVYGTYDQTAGTFTNRIDICERDIEPAAQAAYLYLKLRGVVPHFTLKDALDVVDYRDTDYVPTFIRAQDVAALTGDDSDANRRLNEDLYGMESLHVTEVGRSMNPVSYTVTAAGGNWAGSGTCTLTVPAGGFPAGQENKLSAEITITDTGAPRQLTQGSYLLKLAVVAPAGGSVTFRDSTAQNTKICPTDQASPFSYGPLKVDGTGAGKLQVQASNIAGDYSVTVSAFYLPYIEVMNWGRNSIDMSNIYVYVGTKVAGIQDSEAVRLVSANACNTSFVAHSNLPPLGANCIAGQKVVPGGFNANHGAGYGFYVIAYDEESFARNFTAGGDQGPTWGNAAGEDCNIWTVSKAGDTVYANPSSNPFYNGFDGFQQVRLLVKKASNTYTLVGGGLLDGLAAANGTAKTIDATNLALIRTFLFGNHWYSKFYYYSPGGGFPVPDKWAQSYPGPSPARWNKLDAGTGRPFPYGNTWWPQADANVQAGNHHDLPIIANRGYFTSSADISNVSAGEHKNATYNYGTTHPTYFPDWTALMAYAVSGRTPARVNLNTASAPVMEAACVGLTVTAATLIGFRGTATADGLGNAKWLSNRPETLAVYFNDNADSDGDNASKEDSEKEIWLIKNSGVFTLRGSVFSVACAGMVVDGSDRIRATHSLQAVFDRGRAVKLDGTTYKPVVNLIRVVSSGP